MSLVDNKVFVKMGKGLHGSNVIIYRIIQGVPEIVYKQTLKDRTIFEVPGSPQKNKYYKNTYSVL